MVDISGWVTSVQNYAFSSKMHLRQLEATVGTTSQLRGRPGGWATAPSEPATSRRQMPRACTLHRGQGGFWVLLVEKESWPLLVASGHFLTLTEQLNWHFSCAWECLRIVVLIYFKCWTKEEWSLGLLGQTWCESASVLTIDLLWTSAPRQTINL